MQGVTVPYNFSSQEQMEKWLTKFDTSAQKVCNKYGLPSLMSRIVFDKGEQPFSVYIRSVPLTTPGSHEEKAIDEIIQIFNSGDF